MRTSVTVPPDDRDGLKRLARYLLRAPVSVQRLRVDEDAQAIAPTRVAGGPATSRTQRRGPLDPHDFLARVLVHIPESRRHVIRYYGAYSRVVRARRARHALAFSPGHLPSRQLEATLKVDDRFTRRISESLAAYSAGDFRRSIAAAEEALKVQPRSATAYNNICAGYNGLKEWDQAIVACRQALALDSLMEIAQNNLRFAVSQRKP